MKKYKSIIFILIILITFSSIVESKKKIPNKSNEDNTEVSMQGLHIVGTKIMNGDNKQVFLRGVNRPGTEYSCVKYGKIFDGPSDMSSIKDMKAWNINAVRVPLNEDCWLGIHAPESDHFGAAYRKGIVKFVEDLSSVNFAVIIDLHWSGDNGGSTLATKQEPMPNKANSPRFWQSVANTFKENSNVIFDLYNEPYPYDDDTDKERKGWDSDVAWQCWKEGENCGDDPHIQYEVAGMQQLLDSVRATGATNIVVLGGIQFSTSLTKFLKYLPNDPSQQLAASLHSYEFNYCKSRGCWDTYLRPVFEKLPIVATETGQKDCRNDYLVDFLHYADTNDIHYLAWSWLVASCDGPALITAYDGKPTGFGRGFREHLKSIQYGEVPYWTDTFDMYNDKLTHWVDDWSSATHSINSTQAPGGEGKYSISFEPQADKTLHFMCWGCIQPAIHKSIEFMVHGGVEGNQQFNIELLKLQPDQTNKVEQSYPVKDVLGENNPIRAGKWMKVILELDKAPQDAKYDGLWLNPTSQQPTMYIDKITVRAKVDPPIPPEYEDDNSSSSRIKIISITTTLLILIINLFI